MVRGQAAFPATARLHDAREFRYVFSRGSRFVNPAFVLIAAPGAQPYARLGLALAKRHIRRAVDRNRVKRILRESFRNVRVDLGAVDIVVVARRDTARASNTELLLQLAKLWPQIAGSHIARGSRNPRPIAMHKTRNSAHG